MPADKRNTGLVTIRFDIRTVASIARFYLSKDQTFRNKSDLISRIILEFNTILLDSKLAKEFTKTDEANLFLENIGLNFRHKSTDASYFKQLSIESLGKDSTNQPMDTDAVQRAIRDKLA